MTDPQFRLLRSLYQSVHSVADAFGSEATTPGLVFPTDLPSMDRACRAFLPEDREIHPLEFDAFVTRYGRAGENRPTHDFIELARHLTPTAAYITPPGFDPKGHSRGAFLIGLFLDAKEAAGVRVLVVFDRVET